MKKINNPYALLLLIVTFPCLILLTSCGQAPPGNEAAREQADTQEDYAPEDPQVPPTTDAAKKRVSPPEDYTPIEPRVAENVNPEVAPAAVEEEITTVELFYGTDRKQTGNKEPAKMYGGDRSEATGGSQDPMEYGICEVSIPPGHKVGEIESPKIWKLEFRPNPEKHVVLNKVGTLPKSDFFKKLKTTVQSAGRREAFVFVHGYNVTFAEAAKRTAQIAYDLKFDGAPIMYSWPSKGGTAAYTVDEVNIQWTKLHLQNFLKDIAEQSGAETIHLIAHSMGNRALTRAFADLNEEQDDSIMNKFKKVILTAPDIDADVFKKEIAPAMLKSGTHITLYASSNDLALEASKKVHGYARAGDSGDGLVVMDGIETIDASDANTGLLGHSYFAESPDIITDIFNILNSGTVAALREGLIQRSNATGHYWIVPGPNYREEDPADYSTPEEEAPAPSYRKLLLGALVLAGLGLLCFLFFRRKPS